MPKYQQMGLKEFGPEIERSAAGDDLDPRNLEELQRTMGHRDMRDPRQQAMLREEQKRLQQVQTRQQFSQRLLHRLNTRIGTPEDSDPQAAHAAFMTRLMLQMRQGRP